MVSIQAVASAAGVSVTTASRVINNSDYPVRETTRRRVLEAVAELNYSPSSLARALVTRRTHIVGVIVHDILDPYFAEIVRGVEDVARENGYLAIVCNSDRQIDTETKYLTMLRDYQADGVILAGGGLSGEGADVLMQVVDQMQAGERRTSIISLAPQHFSTRLVTIDNLEASRQATQHLIELGHRRIGFVTGPSNLTTTSLRLQGYREAIIRAGIEPDEALIAPGNFDLESGRAAAEYLAELPSPPTAVFSANDETAIGCLAALRERGIEVPRDMSLVGFDDLKLLQGINPPLTTVQVPLYELGATAMRQLLRTFDGEDVEDTLVLQHRIVPRESTAAPFAEATAETEMIVRPVTTDEGGG